MRTTCDAKIFHFAVRTADPTASPNVICHVLYFTRAGELPAELQFEVDK